MEFYFILIVEICCAVFVESQLNFENDHTKIVPTKFVCPDLQVTDAEGIISSPFYPNTYPTHLSCSWHIQGQVGDLITVKFLDLDIERNNCQDNSCCLFNWIKIGPLVNGSEARICGKDKDGSYHRTFLSSTNKLTVKFQISRFFHGGRGFSFRYKIVPQTTGDCKGSEFTCGNKKCIPSTLRCNGGIECEDGSDEMHCSNRCASGRSCRSVFQCYEADKHCNGIVDCTDFSDEYDCSFCKPNETWCGGNFTQCYNPPMQRCDRNFDCINGADEMDCYSVCPGKLMCDSRGGCYTIEERCNGITQCEDASDEKHCAPQLCNVERGGFLCDNKRCIQQVWTCDRTDDCGDGSDERDCLRNSVLTAALMGSLVCALLLVIAISCTCRLHALRAMENRMQHQSRETSLTRMMTQEFLFREPPPSYDIAVLGDPPGRNSYYGRQSSRPRRPRHSRSRRPPPRTFLPPPVPRTELLDDTSVTLTPITDQSLTRQLDKTEDNDSTKSSENISSKHTRISTHSNQFMRSALHSGQVDVSNITPICHNISGEHSNRNISIINIVSCHPDNDDSGRAFSDNSAASQELSARNTNCSLLAVAELDSDNAQENNFNCDSDTDPLVA